MIGLLRTYLRPYARLIVVVLFLLLVQAIGNLYLPYLNADIINYGIALGDNDYILQTGVADARRDRPHRPGRDRRRLRQRANRHGFRA